MQQINHVPPERMTPEQRRGEIASLLAYGLVRLRSTGIQSSATMAPESDFELGFSGHQSLHGDLVHNTKTES